MAFEQFLNRDSGDETLDLFSDLDPEIRAKKRLEALSNPTIRRLYELDTPSFPENMKSKSFGEDDSVISRLQNSPNIDQNILNNYLSKQKIVPIQLEDTSNLPQLKQGSIEKPTPTFDNLPVKSYLSSALSAIQPSNKSTQGLTTANDDAVFSSFPQLAKSRKELMTDNLFPQQGTTSIPYRSLNETRLPSSIDKYDPLIEKYSKIYNVNPEIARAILQTESSGGNPKFFRGKDIIKNGQVFHAQGPWQILPATAKALGINDPNDIEQSTEGAMKLLGTFSKKYQGDDEKISAAYVTGEGNVDKAIASAGNNPANWKNFLNADARAYIDTVKNNRFIDQPLANRQTTVLSKATKTQEPSTLQTTPPATEQSSTVTAVPVNDGGVMAAEQAIKPRQEQPDYMKQLEEAQDKEGIKELGYGLATAGTTIGSAIAGVTPDYKGLEAIKTGTNLVDQLKTKMATDKTSKDLAEETEFNDPDSATSKFVWSMVKEVYPDLVSKLEAAGISNPSAKQLQKMGVDISKFTTATMRNRTEELKQQYKVDEGTAKKIQTYEKEANPLDESARVVIGREVSRATTASHALKLLDKYKDLDKVPLQTAEAFFYEMASILSPTGNPRADIVEHINSGGTVSQWAAQKIQAITGKPISSNIGDILQNAKDILIGQKDIAMGVIKKWQDAKMNTYIATLPPTAIQAIKDARARHDAIFASDIDEDKLTPQNTAPQGESTKSKLEQALDSQQTNNAPIGNQKQPPPASTDPKIDQYAKKFNIPYAQAKKIIENREEADRKKKEEDLRKNNG